MPPARTWVNLNSDVPKSPVVRVVEDTDRHTVVELELPGVWMEDRQTDHGTFASFAIPGEVTCLADVGKPALPIIECMVAVPNGAKVDIRVLELDHETIADVTPVPFQDTFRHTDFVMDEALYRQDAPYPVRMVEVSERGHMRDLDYVTVTFCPLVCRPAHNEIRACRRIVVELLYAGAEKTSVRLPGPVSPTFEPIYRHLFVNYGFISPEPESTPDLALKGTTFNNQTDSGPLPAGSGGEIEPGTYLIITAAHLRDTIQPLADWRNREGRRVTVTNILDVCDPPTDDAIRSYLIDAYNNWEYPPDFLLLVGDVADIPTHIVPMMSDCACDCSYYGNLDGTLMNGYEILVGRLSNSDAESISNMVYKTIAYQRDPFLSNTNWYRRGCTVNGAGWHGGPTCRNIHDDLMGYGFDYVDELHWGEALTNDDQVVDAVSDGRLLTVYCGHGHSGGWALDNSVEYFSNTDVARLTNGAMLPVVIAASCGTGMFQLSNSHAERWCENNALAYIGAGATPASSLCQNVPAAFIDAYVDGVFNLGQCSAIGIGGFGFNLLGDPGATIWGDVPRSITCTYTSTVPVGPSAFTVTVEDDTGPVQGATVCVMSSNEVYHVGKTDALGHVTLHPVPRFDETLYVTVTSPFHIPHEGTVSVDRDAPFPGYAAHTLDDAAGGNTNGILNPGETVCMDIVLRNYGDTASTNISAILQTTDALVTVTSGSVAYGNLAPGHCATGTFVFAISEAYPHLGERIALIPFSLHVTDQSGGSWEYPVSREEIRSPDMVYVAHTVSAPCEPGATNSIVLTVENAGKEPASACTVTIGTSDAYITILTHTSNFGALDIGNTASNSAHPFVFVSHPATPSGHTATCTLYPRTTGWVNWEGTNSESFAVTIGDAPAPVDLFFDDFESGLSHWAFSGGTWSACTTIAYSATHSLSVAPDTNLLDNVAAMSVGVDASSYQAPLTVSCWLANSFNPWQEYESCCDVSTNGGITWDCIGMHLCAMITYPTFFEWRCPTAFGGQAYTNVRFRLRLQKLGIMPPGDSECWFIDDFRVSVENDNEPPTFAGTTVWTNTVLPGPFAITSTITDAEYGVAECSLHYRVNGGAWTEIAMTSTTNTNEYEAAIPKQLAGNLVDYYLSAYDAFPSTNTSTDPLAAPAEGCYAFSILTPPDTDGDELPDVWEQMYFPELPLASVDPAADPDTDNLDNKGEFISGTCPTNQNDCLVLLIGPSRTTVVVRVEAVDDIEWWYGGQERYYMLEQTHCLIPPDWTAVPGCEQCPAVGEETLPAPIDSCTNVFLRLRVWLE